MLNNIASAVHSNLINTAISFLAILVIYLLVNVIFIRKIENKKKKKRVKIRTFYIAVLIFLFLMARIWVEGFMHLLAVLGLVSAGLVVTNKETIMNLVGWLIITWRGVFSEDELIQIQTYKGYVKSIGVLYITLQEVSDTDFSKLTGKEIKVPNGLTANNSVINYSQTARLVLTDFKLKIPTENISKVRESSLKIVKKTISDFYKENKHYTQTSIARFDGALKDKIDLNPGFVISEEIEAGKPICCMITFYCFVEDKRVLTNKIAISLSKIINL